MILENAKIVVDNEKIEIENCNFYIHKDHIGMKTWGGSFNLISTNKDIMNGIIEIEGNYNGNKLSGKILVSHIGIGRRYLNIDFKGTERLFGYDD